MKGNGNDSLPFVFVPKKMDSKHTSGMHILDLADIPYGTRVTLLLKLLNNPFPRREYTINTVLGSFTEEHSEFQE